MRGRARLLALAAAVALALPAGAGTPPEIDEARRLLAEAVLALKAARAGETRLVALGRAVAAHEAALAAERAALRALAGAERDATAGIAADQQRLGRLLLALEAVARAPQTALLAVRGGPLEASRAAMLMGAAAPALDRQIAELNGRLEGLRQLRRDQETLRRDARETLATLQDLRASSAEAVDRRRRDGLASRADLKAQADAAEARARDLAELAAVLSLAGLETAPAEGFPGAPLSLPVAGRVVAGFGEPDPWGRPGHGISVEAPAYAQVTAPFDATLRYAGPLIDYGQVLVLEPAPGYLLVIAGIARLDRAAGETVLAGEKLGDLGAPLPTSEQILREAAGQASQIAPKRLYLEIRYRGEALDPAEWFDGTRDEARR